jgi:hypothetical protein
MKTELRKNKSLDGVQKLIGRNGYYQTHVENILREVKLGEWCALTSASLRIAVPLPAAYRAMVSPTSI